MWRLIRLIGNGGGVTRLTIGLTTLLLSCGCHRETLVKPERLVQFGYVWQRSWNPSVVDAVKEAERHLDGIVVLGAEMVWRNGLPQPIEANISWSDLHATLKPCALALRIAPYPGPFAPNDAPALAIAAEATSLLKTARAHGVTPSEFEVDFDCAQDKLKGYHEWLQTLRKAVYPTRLVITTLPAWLDEPEFPALVRDADNYVLQVQSVPTVAESGRAVLCDPELARKWVKKASRLGIPFSVALPTYWCLAGYNPEGKLIGIAMDGVQPSWPAGTSMLEFRPNADELANLVGEWRTNRPSGMREVLWYRLPVATDLRNWRWPTLLAVMEGHRPIHDLKVTQAGATPVDFFIANTGEAEDAIDRDVVVRWSGSRLVACDALPGWTVSSSEGKAIFAATNRYPMRLLPETTINIGWLRFEKTPALQTELLPHD
jgi:hypothetical protein